MGKEYSGVIYDYSSSDCWACGLDTNIVNIDSFLI